MKKTDRVRIGTRSPERSDTLQLGTVIIRHSFSQGIVGFPNEVEKNEEVNQRKREEIDDYCVAVQCLDMLINI